MTLDAGRELDARVAREVMGWTIHEHIGFGSHIGECEYPHIDWSPGARYSPARYILWRRFDAQGETWRPSADWNQAMVVRDNVRGRLFSIRLRFKRALQAIITERSGLGAGEMIHPEEVVLLVTPADICNAALAAVVDERLLTRPAAAQEPHPMIDPSSTTPLPGSIATLRNFRSIAGDGYIKLSRTDLDGLERERDSAHVALGRFAVMLTKVHDWLAYRPAMLEREEGGVALKRDVARVLHRPMLADLPAAGADSGETP